MSNILQQIKSVVIVKPLNLVEYHEDYEGLTLYVWVNLTHEMHKKYTDLQVRGLTITNQIETRSKRIPKAKGEAKKKFKEQIAALTEEMEQVNLETHDWYSEVWSKHKDPSTHYSPAEVQDFAERMMEEDAALYKWICNRTQAMILVHRTNYLKN